MTSDNVISAPKARSQNCSFWEALHLMVDLQRCMGWEEDSPELNDIKVRAQHLRDDIADIQSSGKLNSEEVTLLTEMSSQLYRLSGEYIE